MSSITSTGLGSGLKINDIVEAIVGAEKDPALAKMIKSSGQATAMISAYGMLNSELSAFKDSYKDLGRTSTFSAATATSSDSTILDAKLGIGAVAGSWEFEVQQRAQAQTVVSSVDTSYAEATSEVGTGTITFTYGTYNDDGSFSVNPDKALETLSIDSANNSLDKMRDAINEGDYSVSASIINDGTNYRLVLTNKETGEANAMQITVVDGDGDNSDASGLSSLTYSPTVKHMESTSTAQDAKIEMNGITITRDSNEISNVIEGVTLNINGETEMNKKVSLTIKQDNSVVEEQLKAFVENYNNTITKMNSLTADGGGQGSDGALNGDSTVRNIQNQMRGVLNTSLTHIGGAVQSFADLGMLTNRDGTLSLDADKLSGIMKNDMQSVANFFTASGAANDSFIDFESNSSLTKPGTYDIEVTKLATQGQLTGAIHAGFPMTIDASNDTFKMRLDGFLSEDIILSSQTYNSIEELTTELQSKINSDPNFVENGLNVSIIESAGAFSITSNSYGSSSTVAFTEIEDPSFTTLLGFAVSGGVNGEDIEGLIDGKAAYGDGQFLLSESGDSTGIKVKVDGGPLGERGQVTYAEGMSTVMNDMLDGMIDINISSTKGDIESSGSIIDGKVDSLYKKINQIDEQQASLMYKMDKMEARLYKQFNAMDMAVSSLNNTREYLKLSLDALPGYTRDK
ncbi:flagellar filament capping protein FliD [Psychromonas sp. Urea-02u-13]|uniref:flagellar filament capping protein FliD n=1 Tax=Psychromonas sp. Urea-02u-13 TaxID=2058326 RepID=UPI000C344649|nr:flagellar filament capping protein FliD [Psychromonas sp. Urea-02u-13]PKG39895.1 flagellar hook-associated protein [Psychromonas sp. Urea-02u-13]